MKKLLSLCFVLLLLLPLATLSVAADGTTEDGLEYTITGGKVTITRYSGSADTLTVPATIDGCPVTAIGDRAFSFCTGLKSITLPEGVSSIGNFAFHGCVSLSGITLPEGVSSIGYGAFAYCESLTSITLPEGVSSIGFGTFSDCTDLTSIALPEGVSSIGDRAFSNCTGLTNITLPDSVTSIGNNAFADCSALREVSYAGSQKQWASIDIAGGNSALGSAAIFYKVQAAETARQKGSSQGSPFDGGFSPLVILAFAIFLVGGAVHLAQKH